MKKEKTDIFVYADWKGLNGPQLMGILSAQQVGNRKAFSFHYNSDWLKQKKRFLLDPDIQFFLATNIRKERKTLVSF